MELFEQLRREYEFGTGTVKGVARKFGVHRRMVRQAVESAMPPLRGYKVRAKPALGPVEAFIDAILAADATAPRKQRHTARGGPTFVSTGGPSFDSEARPAGRRSRPSSARRTAMPAGR